MTPLRISADFNGLVDGPRDPERTAVVLDTLGAIRDLSNAGVVLVEGMPLIAVDISDEDEDLEGHGTAQYDWDHKWWVVEFDEQGVRYVPGGDRTLVSTFLCVQCRTPLPTHPHYGGPAVDACPNCATSVLAAIAPPPSPDAGHSATVT